MDSSGCVGIGTASPTEYTYRSTNPAIVSTGSKYCQQKLKQLRCLSRLVVLGL